MNTTAGGAETPRSDTTDDAVIDATLAKSLDSLDDAVNYMKWIVDMAAPYLEGPILEVGAGHGTFTGSFSAYGSVHAVEPGEYAGRVLADRFREDPKVDVTLGLLDEAPTDVEFGSAVMINVLEHIADDAGTLEAIHGRLRPGGHLVLWVPAFEFLYSDFDKKLGHERRYRRKQLEELVERNGFGVVESKYVNAPGWFSWLILVRLLRQEPTGTTTVAIFDRFIVPVVRWLETWIRPPFGQSIFLVARKPPTASTS